MRLSLNSPPSLLLVLGLPLLAEAMALHKDSSGEQAMKRGPADILAPPISPDGEEKNYGWSGRAWKKAAKRDDDPVSRNDDQRRGLLDLLGLGNVLGLGNDQGTTQPAQPVETPNNQDTSEITGDDEENRGFRGWIKRQDLGSTNDDTTSPQTESDVEVNYGYRVWSKRDGNDASSPPAPVITGEGNWGMRAWVKREQSDDSQTKKLVKLIKRDDEITNKVEKNFGAYRGF